jgi:hypothetical protein
MNVIRSHDVIEHAKAVALPGPKKPLEVMAAVSGKLAKELLLMTPMGNLTR